MPPSDRPKASYLDWFKELIANYKLIAMLIVALGGYSGLNLWKDVESYRAVPDPVAEKPDEKPVEKSSVNYAPVNHSHPKQSVDAAIRAHIARDHIEDHADLHQ